MASSAQLKIIIDAATGGAESALGSLDSKLSGLGKFGKVAAIGLGAAAAGAAVVGTAAIAGAAGVLKLTMEAAKVEQSRVTFGRLAEDIGSTANVMIKDLRNATRGMVSDADLWNTSNKMVTMGLAETSKQASQLAEMGSQLAIAMGKDAVSGMEEFGLLLANQSIPRLDTFGISAGKVRERMAELTGTTQAAFKTEEDLNYERDKTLDRMTELEGKLKLATMQQDEYNKKTKESTKLAKEMQIDKISQELDELKNYYESLGDAVIDETKAMARGAAFMQATMEQGTIAMKRVGEQGIGTMQDLDRLKATFDNVGKSIGRAFLPALGLVATAIRDQLLKYGPEIEAFAKNAGKWLAKELPAALERGAEAIGDAFLYMETNLPKAVEAIRGYLEANKKDFEQFATDMEGIKKRLDEAGVLDWFDEQRAKMQTPEFKAWADLLGIPSLLKYETELPTIMKGIADKGFEGYHLRMLGQMSRTQEIVTTGASDMVRAYERPILAGVSDMTRASDDLIVKPWQEAVPRMKDQLYRTAEAVTTGMAGMAEAAATQTAKVPEAIATGMGEAATAASTGMEGVATAVSTSAEGMATSAQTAMDGVKLTFTTGWAGLATEASTQMTAISTAVSTGMTSVATAFTTGMTSAKGAVVAGMALIKSTVTSGMAGVRAAVTSGMAAVRAAFTSGMAAARAAVASAMASIRSIVAAGMSAVRSSIASAAASVRSLGSAFASTASSIAGSVSRIVSSARAAASALQSIKTPAALTGHSPSPFENTLVNVGNLMREMSRQTIPEFGSAWQTLGAGGAGPSQSNSYYYTLNVHSNASTEPIAADFMVLEALAGA